MSRHCSRARLLPLWAALSLCGCATAPPPKPIASDPVEPLLHAGRKVENAISATKVMIERSRGASYLPDLYLRLAELYTEQARYTWLAVYERRRARGEEGRALDVPAARLLKNLAIATYERVLHDFPRYERDDEALFLMAHEYRELGQPAEMKATYERLITQYPRSPHRLEAYLILGDAAFDAGELDRAERSYNAVLAAPESHVTPLARYKLGWVRVNREDCKGAVGMFERILRDKSTPRGERALVATQKSLNIHREALSDLAYCYPDVYPDKPAGPYLKALADNSSDYMAAMRRVAKRFFIKELYGQAAAALREVLGASVAEEAALEDARRLYDSVDKARAYDFAAEDVERIGRVFEQRYYDFRLARDKRDKLFAELEVYARDIATKAQLTARERRSPALRTAAAAAYGTYLAYFPGSPARLEMEQNRADALAEADQPLAAGRAFERVAALLGDKGDKGDKEPRDKEGRRQAQLNAIASYQQALEKGTLSRLERIIAWSGIRAQGRALIAERPDDDNIVKVKLSVARSFYDAGDYGPAADLFYALARQYPAAAEGLIAAHLALDAMRLAENYQRLATMGKMMLADKRLGDDAFKAEIADIVAKTEQRQVTEITIAASGGHQEELLSYAKRNKGSGLGEQALYNALLVARTEGDIDRFYALGEEFIDQYPRSGQRGEVMLALATVASDRGDFGQAAEYLERTYAAEPRAKEAVQRMLTAATIRSVLGDAKAADDIKELSARGLAQKEIDNLLVELARSGNTTTLSQLLGAAPVPGTVAEFLRGYFALGRGDPEDAARRLGNASVASSDDPAVSEAIAKARFLMGEMVYDAFLQGGKGDLGDAIAEKTQLLAAADEAYAQAIQGRQPHWALTAIARVADAYQRFAVFLRGLKLPDELSAEERGQLSTAISAKSEEAQKRSRELKAVCAKRAREARVFSEAVRACLGDEPFPDKIAVLPALAARRAGDPPGASELRAALLKNPKNVDTLVKLAELYLGGGDLGTALLVLDRADGVDPRRSEVWNLRGVALERLGESDAAYQAWKKAADLDARNTQARLNLAAQLATYGYADEAAGELKRAGGAIAPHGAASEHPNLSVLSRLAGGHK